MKPDLFMPALSQLPSGTWGLFGPTAFKGYLLKHGLPASIDTAATISVDFLERLPVSLRNLHVMVLRLGAASDGRGTQFVLIATPHRLDDFFLREDAKEDATGYTLFRPSADTEALAPYRCSPRSPRRPW